MARNSNFVKAVTIVSSLALTLGIVSPVQAADKTVVTIWSFGDVIRPEFATAYEKLNPDIDLVIKNFLDDRIDIPSSLLSHEN